VSEWQSIETVPKDGTVIDLGGLEWDGRWRRWCDAHWAPLWDGQSEIESWRGPWSDDYESSLPDQRFKPTHWMLPPDPPAR
jgi:hypothetical protein